MSCTGQVFLIEHILIFRACILILLSTVSILLLSPLNLSNSILEGLTVIDCPFLFLNPQIQGGAKAPSNVVPVMAVIKISVVETGGPLMSIQNGQASPHSH